MKTSRLILLVMIALSLVLALASCEVKTEETTAGTTGDPATEAEVSATAGELETADETTLSDTQAATTAAPATTAKPATTAAPATTAKPATTAAPATTAKPADTTVPATEPPEPVYAVPTMASAVKQPQAGDDPMKLSGIENVMRIAYVLQHAENYTVNGEGTVTTKVSIFLLGTQTYKQSVQVYKDYDRGVMLEVDLTKTLNAPISVNKAWQTCFVGDTALSRDPKSSSTSSWNGRSTAWKTDAVSPTSRSEYRAEYGLFGFELTNYILNTDTVKSWSSVKNNGDGTYTQTINPDVSKATGDCVRRMKKMGGLDEYPKFSSSAITMTFDANWRILSLHTEEKYSAKTMGIDAKDCTASTDYVYSYGNADVSAYTSFFSKYVK